MMHESTAWDGEEISLPEHPINIPHGTQWVGRVLDSLGRRTSRSVVVPHDIYVQKMKEAGKYSEEMPIRNKPVSRRRAQ